MALTPSEQEELRQLEMLAQPVKGGLSPQEAQELAQLEAMAGAPQPQQSQPLEAAVQGFGQAATLGYLPQIQAVTEPLIQGALGLFGDNTDEQLRAQGFNIEQPQQGYTQRRDQYIAEQQRLQEQNPIASTVGGVAGGLASGIATTGAIPFKAGAGLAGRLGQAVASGAIQGAVRNPGDTQGEISPLQLEDRAQNAALDAATGLVFQGGLEGIGAAGRALKGADSKIGRAVQKYAFEAISPSKAVSTKAVKDKSIYRIGQTVLDNNLIPPGAGIEDILVNTEDAIKKSGDQIGQIYSSLDNNPSLAIKPEDVKNIATSYAEKASERLSGTVDGKDIARKLDKVIKTIPKDANFSDLRKWRASIDDQINFSKANKDLPGYQQELLKLRSEVQDRIAELAGKVDPNLKTQFKRENKNFANLFKVKEMAENKAAANITNTNFGIREGFGAGIGALVGSSAGPVGTAAGAALGGLTANTLKKYGSPFVAITASKIAKKLSSNPESLGKFSEPLLKAASLSPADFVRTVNNIMKDPEYKKMENGQFSRGNK
jgi:hypothetical protein